MIRTFLNLLLIFLVFTVDSFADNSGAAVIKLRMGNKVLDFTHHKHQKLTKGQCWECHDKTPGKINNWGESTAHKICIPCHDLNEKGPITCKGCHKKS